MRIIGSGKVRIIRLAILLTIFLSACGPGESASPTDTSASLAITTPIFTPIPPTLISPTDAPESIVVEYEDPEGDCLNYDDIANACNPLGVDILTVTISKEGPLTIVFEVASTGFEGLRALPYFGMVVAIDLDRDPTTGFTSIWPESHGIGPELVFLWAIEGGVDSGLGFSQYAPDGSTTNGDSSLVEWSVLDDNHLQVVISEELLTSQSFGIAGDFTIYGVHDFFVDGGYITFPEGALILID